MLRTTLLTALLEGGVPRDQVQKIAMHRSGESSARYDRRRTALTGHPLYDLEDKYEDQSEGRDTNTGDEQEKVESKKAGGALALLGYVMLADQGSPRITNP